MRLMMQLELHRAMRQPGSAKLKSGKARIRSLLSKLLKRCKFGAASSPRFEERNRREEQGPERTLQTSPPLFLALRGRRLRRACRCALAKATKSRCTTAMVDSAQARPRRGCWGVKGAPRRLQQRAALPGVHPRHSAVPRGRRQRMGEERSSPTKPCTVLTLRKNNCFVILIGNTGTLHVLTLLLLHTSFRSLPGLGKR